MTPFRETRGICSRGRYRRYVSLAPSILSAKPSLGQSSRAIRSWSMRQPRYSLAMSRHIVFWLRFSARQRMYLIMVLLQRPSWSSGKLPRSGGVGVNSFCENVYEDILRHFTEIVRGRRTPRATNAENEHNPFSPHGGPPSWLTVIHNNSRSSTTPLDQAAQIHRQTPLAWRTRGFSAPPVPGSRSGELNVVHVTRRRVLRQLRISVSIIISA